MADVLITPVAPAAASAWPYSLQLDYDGNHNPIYIGMAKAGSALTESAWLIQQLTYDGANNLTAKRYANGSLAFTQRWDERLTLSYF